MQILGHSVIRSRLQHLYQKQLLPHALLFAGSNGVGKKLVALELFRGLYCTDSGVYGGCGSCSTCKAINRCEAPQFHVIDAQEREAGTVENIRRLLYSLHLRVAKGTQKVLLIDNAEHLSVQAQNVLLKGLEEPRKDTYFCLITSSASRLLKTIHSRCQSWIFNELSEDDVRSILQSNYAAACNSASELEALTKLAHGSFANIEDLLSHTQVWEEMKVFIQAVVEKKTDIAIKQIQNLKRKKEILPSCFTALRSIARENMYDAHDIRAKQAWSIFLHNCLVAEGLVFDRNLSAELVLSTIVLGLHSPTDDSAFAAVGDAAATLESICV